MKPAELQVLMHAVLDGEATAAEIRELQQALAADPAARARFEEWRELWDGLGQIERAYPPEGLVAAVMAALPRQRPAGEDDDQPFPAPGVFAPSSTGSRVTTGETSTTVHAISRTGPFTRGESMTSKRSKVWIGVAVAVAAIAIGSQFVDYPPKGQDAAGTIAPAQRYRAQQMTGDDVKVGGASGVQAGQPGAIAPAAVGGAAARDALDASRNALDASRSALDASRAALDGVNRAALDGTNRNALDSSRAALDASRAALDGINRAALDGTHRNRNALDGTNRNALDASRAALDASRSAVDASRNALDGTNRSALDSSRNALDMSRSALDASRAALDGINRNALDGTNRSALDASRAALDATRSALDGANRNALDASRNALDASRSALDANRSALDAAKK